MPHPVFVRLFIAEYMGFKMKRMFYILPGNLIQQLLKVSPDEISYVPLFLVFQVTLIPDSCRDINR